jgi:hypothetical protein
MPLFLGDVHAKFQRYETFLKENPNSIQVGDMGIGFFSWPHGEPGANPPYNKMVAANARFIRGNHDNPGVCRNHTQWIADGTVEGDMMLVGGAFSIDKAYRTEGYNWWDDEELSYEEMLEIQEIYLKNKPRIMVTHDCPEFVVPFIHSHHFGISTRTGQFFDRLFEEHQPQIWVHGHHHVSLDHVLKGTRFVCLAELEHKVIE